MLFSKLCKPGSIDHGEFKDSDFDVDRQPEIVLWRPKPEVIMSPKIRYISSKFQRQTWIFDNREINRSVFRPFYQPPTTRNSQRYQQCLYYCNYYRDNWNSNGKSVVYETEPWFMESSKMCRQVIATATDCRKQRRGC